MVPSPQRGILLSVTDQGERTEPRDIVGQSEGVRVLTREASALESLADISQEA